METLTVKFGIKAYLFTLPFILLTFGINIAFYFTDITYFYCLLALNIIALVLMLYYFFKTKIILTGTEVEIVTVFFKNVIDLSDIKEVKKNMGRLYFIDEDGNVLFHLYFYMENINVFLKLINK